MTLLRQVSERLDPRGRPYEDYFLAWRYEGKNYWVRVKPSFVRDHKFLYASAVNVPRGETLEKYID